LPTYDFDLFVIGGGSAGVRCSRMSASFGARVGMAEEKYLGGTCVNVGCVPKKLFSYGSHYGEELEDARGYGWTVDGVDFDWSTLVANKDKEIARLNDVYRRMLDRAGVEVFDARATVTGPHSVRVGGREVTAEHIVVATGGWPWVPDDLPGVEHAITSNEVFSLPELPRRLVVGGGGYIAVEFASIFAGLGVHVDLVYRGPLFLRGFDDDVRHEIANEMRKKGVHLHFDCVFARIDRSEAGLHVVLTDGDTMDADQVLMALGRRPNVAGLGLQEVGVALGEGGAVVVDEHFQTTVPSIYALGDVIDRVQLTPVALAEGMVLARNLFCGAAQKVSYRDIPTAVFTHPNIGTVGLTESEAREQYGKLRLYKSLFKPMRHTMTGRNEKTFMKLVVDDATDRVVGCHMVGPDAGEIIQGLAVAMTCGATKAQFDATIGIHPTAAEEFVTMRTPVT
jgi:glutathione reductase (NADPH)